MGVVHRVGPALEVVRGLPAGSVDLVASSPPFWALRNYNDSAGQWGAEATPADFLDNLLDLMVALRRVLVPWGSTALELGDTFAGSGGAGGDYGAAGLRSGQPVFGGSSKAVRAPAADGVRPAPIQDLSDKRQPGGPGCPLAKSLCLIPGLFAGSLAYGRNLLRPERVLEPWRVRNLIVWARRNPAPGALADKFRPAVSYITVATPSPRRWFDLDAVRTEYSARSNPRTPAGVDSRVRSSKSAPDGNRSTLADRDNDGLGAPPTDYWDDEYDGDVAWLINTQPSKLAHYAMWPAPLARRLVLSMCPPEVCRVCGEPRRRIVGPVEYRGDGASRPRDRWEWGGLDRGRSSQGRAEPGHITRHAPTVGWSDCGHGDFRAGVVLDPFYGTGTTGAVADLYGRDAIGIDLDPANSALLERRAAEVKRSLFGVAPQLDGQLSLGV